MIALGSGAVTQKLKIDDYLPIPWVDRAMSRMSHTTARMSDTERNLRMNRFIFGFLLNFREACLDYLPADLSVFRIVFRKK